MKNYTLLAPGPVTVEPEALKAFGRAPIHHRTPEFEACLLSCRKKLGEVLGVSRPVYTLCSTGSGAMEAAVVNFLSPGDKVLCMVSGKFGERWANMLDAYGINCIRFEIDWGKSLEPNEILELIKASGDIKAIYTQMCETSTGALHPVEELASLVKQYDKDCLVCVDGITGLLTLPLDLAKQDIDIIVGGSQKAFMLPTGLSFIYLSELAETKMDTAGLPRYYWDLKKELKAYQMGQTNFSSPVNLYFALEKVLDYILSIGTSTHYAVIEERASSFRSFLQKLGLELVAEKPAPALTAFYAPASIDSSKLRKAIEAEHGITLMGGQEQLKGKILRWGHIGFQTEKDILQGRQALILGLNNLGCNYDLALADLT